MAEQSSVATGSASRDHSSVAAAIKGLAMTGPSPASPATSEPRMPQAKPFVVAPRAREKTSARTEATTISPVSIDPVKVSEQLRADTARLDGSKQEANRPASERTSGIRSTVLKAATPDLSKVGKVMKAEGSMPNASNRSAPDLAGKHLAGKLLGSLPAAGWFKRSRAAKPVTEASETSGGEAARTDAVPTPVHPVLAHAARAPTMRRSPLATTALLAILAGGTSGVLATAAISKYYYGGEGGMLTSSSELQDTVTRIESEVQVLKGNAEQVVQTERSVTQTTERLDRLERAQAEAAAKLQRLGEGPERVRPSAASAMAAVPPPSTTVREAVPPTPRPPVVAASPPPRPAPRAAAEPASRLPVLEGWTLRDVTRGVALIEGRRGFYEVLAGDPIPGLGRVDAIRRQDGRWVVVTPKGLVVSR